MQRHWHTPAAVLVAGAMVAVAVYLALRTAPSQREPPSAVPRDAAPRVDPPREPPRRSQPHDHAPATRQDEGKAEPVAPPSAARVGDERVPAAERAMAVAGPLAMPPVDAAVSRRVAQDARAAFETLRPTVRAACWDSTAGPEAPDRVALTLSLSYDASGSVIASGVAESREASRPGLAACLGPLVHALEVSAPGSNVSIELGVTLP